MQIYIFFTQKYKEAIYWYEELKTNIENNFENEKNGGSSRYTQIINTLSSCFFFIKDYKKSIDLCDIGLHFWKIITSTL
ncbi:MAG: hypothetical protein FWF57_00995 [Defluviitaleaceae bacterium]|nr:hypothetical protein [Defluviitaleaceae bacterium]